MENEQIEEIEKRRTGKSEKTVLYSKINTFFQNINVMFNIMKWTKYITTIPRFQYNIIKICVYNIDD